MNENIGYKIIMFFSLKKTTTSSLNQTNYILIFHNYSVSPNISY